MTEVSERASGSRASTFAPIDRAGGDFDRHLREARHHAPLDAAARENTRMRSVKRLVLRVARIFTHQQVAYNSEVVDALADLDRRLQVVQGDVDRRGAITRASITSLELAMSSAMESLADARDQLADHVGRVSELAVYVAEQDAARREVRARLERVEAAPRRRDEEPPASSPDVASSPGGSGDLAGFYADLEEAFRGSREEVGRRLEAYLSDIERVKGLGLPVVDVGCGRGEWLELLAGYDVPAYGVDINAVFVDANNARSLDVRLGDGIAHLSALEPSSVAAVTAFHLVEHLPLGTLVALVDAALRALVSGGVLILETPNPTNVIVGSSSFWLDPTHRQPIPPQLLSFLATNRGFADVEVRYLNPPDEPPFALRGQDAGAERLLETLNWAFLGPMDYAVVARRS